MIQRVVRVVQTVVLVGGGLLLFFTLMEMLRAYQTLHTLHPVAGTLFGILLLAAVLTLAVWYGATVGRRPRVLHAPVGVNPATAQGAELRAYARFQARLLRRLAANPQVPPAQQARLQRQSERVREALAAGSDAADLSRCVRDTQDQFITPVVEPLDTRARDEVAGSVRDVMLAVTLSPWRTIDLLVVLARNLRMVVRVMTIYNARPPLREQLYILRDVFTVVVTVNFLSYGSQLFQKLTSSVPILGRFTDDIAQGVGAGLLTSVSGHAAIGRCRSYGCWDAQEAERSIRANLQRFLGDVKQIIVNDVLLRLRRSVEAQMPEPERPADLQTQLREGVSEALDESAGFLDVLIVRPALATGRGVAGTGILMGRAITRSGQVTGAALASSGRWIERCTLDLWHRVQTLRKRDADGAKPEAGGGGDPTPPETRKP